MPLTRYEIRNEYSLANPDLYRAAAKDDPEGLLEGVAMAGLVGVVRQLGDLAEFAAEVFHDLHEEVLATAARGHELLIRVQQLEAELPFVEKLMLAESNYVNFAYNPGLEWHANIENEQNHFTQGDLPRFIRNAYEDCRGPPRLFLLDKFDVAGAGACLKRYTDPSFFRMEWASSELMKAEKEQLDKKARRIKKKGRRQRNGEFRDTFLAVHMQPRMRPAPLEVENSASSSIHSHIPNSQHSSEQDGVHKGLQGPEQKLEPSRLLIPEGGGLNLKASVDVLPQDAEHSEVLMVSSALSQHLEERVNETEIKSVDAEFVSTEFDSGKAEEAGASDIEIQKKIFCIGVKLSEDVTDFASETDNYMDALTTIDSEVETDSDVKTIVQVDGELMSNSRHEDDPVHTKQVITDCLEKTDETELIAENGIDSGHNTPEEGDTSVGTEPTHISSPDASLVEENKSVFDDDSHASSKSSVSTPIIRSLPSTPALEKSTVIFEERLESESTEGIPETPETPAENEHERLELETLTSAFHQLPEPVVPLDNGSRSVYSDDFGSLSSHFGGKSTVLPSRELSMVHAEKDSFEDSESEASEAMRELSPHSSANSSIQPMKWASEFSRHPNIALDSSDDELGGMQVSSSSSSSSSSALSSPRPSTLATSVFDNKPLSPIKSSPESLLHLSPQSVGRMTPHSPPASSSLPPPGHAQLASHIPLSQQSGYGFLPEFTSGLHNIPVGDVTSQKQDEGFPAEDCEHFPPPPPLPPLEWRTTRRFGGLLSSSKISDSSPRPPIPEKPLWRLRDSSQAANLPPVPQGVHMQDDEFVHAPNSSPTLHGGFQEFSMHYDGLEQSQTKDAYASQTYSKIFEASSPGHVFPEELAAISGRSNEPVQPSILLRRDSMPHEVPITVAESSITEHPGTESAPLLWTNKSTHSFRSISSESSVDDKEQDNAVSSLQEEPVRERSSAGSKSRTSVPHEIFAEDDCIDSSQKEKQIAAPQRQLSTDACPPLPSSVLESEMVRSSAAPKIERKDSLIAAIASHDKSTLRKVPEWSQSSRTPRTDDREVLLEQIRTGSFSLRRAKVEKQETPRPVASINVAAILEKANAIRQAFAGSDDEDEDDDWSDG
ncbi:hypothetical protein GOP47_0002269 [Adiantum capillus-veneris]|uniref:Protein SCAR n=1 Tax=Adiantum capillus-veneris TaxID=13818 RepID=A0A9D4ZNF5_ADICA|nr:hypothetical protein GOP47_0001622 [Adiantum capillus-veneris]KAI5082526.1 hypothetical protein GOP47_0002269 [Adiantum capillus-veneris]